MRERRLFHLVPLAAWRAFTSARGDDGDWRPPSLASEGFVHLSFAEQLAGTLAAHFGPDDRLLLLEVALPPDDPALVLEPSRGGVLFPHLRRALALHEVARCWELACSRSSGWTLPALGPEPDRDRPRGASTAPRGGA